MPCSLQLGYCCCFSHCNFAVRQKPLDILFFSGGCLGRSICARVISAQLFSHKKLKPAVVHARILGNKKQYVESGFVTVGSSNTVRLRVEGNHPYISGFFGLLSFSGYSAPGNGSYIIDLVLSFPCRPMALHGSLPFCLSRCNRDLS